MSKIYSRKRFIIKPKKFGCKTSSKILKILVILILIIVVYQTILSYIEPVFESLCEDEVKKISTIISNQESTKMMNKYQYDELYTIEKDEAGDIVIIKSNVVPINNMISDLTEAIQNRFNEIEKTQIDIPIGNLLGIYYFSGVGPSIHARVITSGTLDTEIKSEFISKGINQTLHRIYVEFKCNAKIITPIKSFQKPITNQVLIAEHVIVGNIPSTYYNFDGMTGAEDILNMVD